LVGAVVYHASPSTKIVAATESVTSKIEVTLVAKLGTKDEFMACETGC
jgi:hypothetical protein